MGRNPMLASSSFSKVPRARDKDYANAVEQVGLNYVHANQHALTVPTGVARVLKDCDVPHQAFAVFVWDANGDLCGSAHTSSMLEGCNLVINSNLPRKLSQILHDQSSLKQESMVESGIGSHNSFLSPSREDFDDLPPSGIPSCDHTRPNKRYRTTAKAYNAAIPSQSSNGDSSPEFDTEDNSYESITIGDRDKIDEIYRARFTELQQTDCKTVCKAWINEVEPKKQSKYPYRGKNNGVGIPPPWWPSGVIHREPDHIKKADRLKLLLTLMRIRYNDGKPVSAVRLRRRIEADSKIEPEKKLIVYEIVRVREFEERFEDKEVDPDAQITVKRTTANKNLPKRSRQSSVSVKDETKDNLVWDKQERKSSTDNSSVRRDSRQPRRIETSNNIQSPSVKRSSVSHVVNNRNGLERLMISQQRSPGSNNICDSSLDSSQGPRSSTLVDEFDLSEYSRHPAIGASRPTNQDDLMPNPHCVPRTLSFGSAQHGLDIRDTYDTVTATASDNYESCFSPSAAPQYVNQMPIDYSHGVTPFSAMHQSAIAVEHPYSYPPVADGSDTRAQSFAHHHLSSVPELKFEQQSFCDPFRRDHFLQHQARWDYTDSQNTCKRRERKTFYP